MLNQVILVGRLTQDIKVKEGEGGSKYCDITIAIPRSFKNEEGAYDTDFIEVKTFGNVAENIAEYCAKGDVVGVKGRVQAKEIEKYHTKMTVMEIIAEKITFLSTKKD